MKIHRSNLFLHLSTFFIIAMLLLGISKPQPVVAQQSNPVLENVRVDIWPEYDQPSVLVIYHISIATDVTLPANMAFRIPAASGKPFAVAMQDSNGLYNLNYELSAAGEWILVRFTAPVPDVRIEYYDPGLAKDGSQRSYTFRWPADYTVNNLTMSIQQPATASGMSFRPELSAGQQAEDGLTYFTLAAGKVTAGSDFDLSMNYQKPDDSLTASEAFQPAQANEPVDENTTGMVRMEQLLPWIIGGLGVLLMAFGIFIYFRRNTIAAHPVEAGKKRHSSRVERAASAVSVPETGEGVYCHQCGKKAGPGDVFCRACGTKLR